MVTDRPILSVEWNIGNGLGYGEFGFGNGFGGGFDNEIGYEKLANNQQPFKLQLRPNPFKIVHILDIPSNPPEHGTIHNMA